jgi:hypothetical protein
MGHGVGTQTQGDTTVSERATVLGMVLAEKGGEKINGKMPSRGLDRLELTSKKDGGRIEEALRLTNKENGGCGQSFRLSRLGIWRLRR